MLMFTVVMNNMSPEQQTPTGEDLSTRMDAMAQGWEEEKLHRESLSPEELDDLVRTEVVQMSEEAVANFASQDSVLSRIRFNQIVNPAARIGDYDRIWEEVSGRYKDEFQKVEEAVVAVTEDRLSYQDAPISQEDKAAALRANMESKSADRYSRALLRLEKDFGEESVANTTQGIHRQFMKSMSALGFEDVSAYSESLSWVYWDLGKQAAFAESPEAFENSAYYSGAMPITGAEASKADSDAAFRQQRAIVLRHIGWEVFHREGAIDSVLADLPRGLLGVEDEINYIVKNSDSDEGLHSWEYARVGQVLESIARAKEAYGSNDSQPVAA